MNNITTIGIDLAKEVFAVCAMDQTGTVVYQKAMKRDAFIRWASQLAPCQITMEACGSAHHWGRWFAAHGHTARLIAAEFVQPFRKSFAAKNDRNDAEAIAIATRQSTMRFVPVKSIEQQSILAWHRMREGYKTERTALLNRLRGLLAEFGIWLPLSADKLIRQLPSLSQNPQIPDAMQGILLEGMDQLNALQERLRRCDQVISQHAAADPAAQRIIALSGVGTLTASAVVSSVSDAVNYRNGRQFAAWLGLVPRQMSSGGKTQLGRTSRRGDRYLRALLVQGAKSALQAALRQRPDQAHHLQQWIVQLYGRVGYHKTLVAIANKHARIIWVMLARQETYRPVD
jgi:transposase